MWDYLKDFEKFYKYYVDFHNRLVELDYYDYDDIVSVRQMHSMFSSVFCKILDYYQGDTDYVALMYDDKSLFDVLIMPAERHFNIGSRLEFLMAGFNATSDTFCKMTVEAEIADREKIIMLENLRKITCAYHVVVTGVWSKLETSRLTKLLEENRGELSLEKERFFTYINSRKSLVILIEKNGGIIRLNEAAVEQFGIDFQSGHYNIMDILDYHFISFESFLRTYSGTSLKPVRMMNGEKFEICVEPLVIRDNSPMEYFITLKRKKQKTPLIMKGSGRYNHAHSVGMQARLTHMESQICEMVTKGSSSKEIADNLNISIDTVKTHRKNIRKKLELNKTGVNMYIYLKNIDNNKL